MHSRFPGDPARGWQVARYGFLLGLLLLLSGSPLPARAEDEYAVKAAFLIHFMNFVQWPEQSFRQPDDPFNLCVVGGNPFGKSIEPIARKTAQGRPIRLIREPKGGNGTRCQVVYIAGDSDEQVREYLDTWAEPGVLTIGDVAGFAEMGGVIGYKMINNRVRFRLNDEAAEEAQLQVSVKLRKVALKK